MSMAALLLRVMAASLTVATGVVVVDLSASLAPVVPVSEMIRSDGYYADPNIGLAKR
jgi:hypothetical protein